MTTTKNTKGMTLVDLEEKATETTITFPGLFPMTLYGDLVQRAMIGYNRAINSNHSIIVSDPTAYVAGLIGEYSSKLQSKDSSAIDWAEAMGFFWGYGGIPHIEVLGNLKFLEDQEKEWAAAQLSNKK